MTNHFAAIGISVSSPDEMQVEMARAAKHAKKIRCQDGYYLRWASKPGAELWIHVDMRGRWMGVTPYFRGQARMTVEVDKNVLRQGFTLLEGAVHGWADPRNDEPQSGKYPLVFDLIDKGRYRPFALPFRSQVHLSAFAHELSVYDSDDDFKASTSGGKLASEAFIPSGLFKPGGTSVNPPESIAVIAGHIIETEQLRNPLTGSCFCWMRIKTYGGEVDIVSEAKLISKAAVVGGVASGQFWLCGEILRPKFGEQLGRIRKLKRMFWH